MRAARFCEVEWLACMLAAMSCAGCEHSMVWLGSDHRDPVVTSGTTRLDAGASESPHDAGSPMPDAASSSDLPATTRDASSPSEDAATAPPDAGATDAAVSGRSAPGPRLPSARGACPDMPVGPSMVEFDNLSAQIWVGDKQPGQHGPLLVYWHGTGSIPSEVTTMLGTTPNDILGSGGVIVALADSTGTGEIVATGTWTTDDLQVADDIVACALQRRDIDPERIYSAGCDSGGIQAAMMVYERSHYTAAAMMSSGGIINLRTLSEPLHVPPVITTHGPTGNDVVIVDFAETSQRLDQDIATHGGLAVDCPHDGGHCGAPANLVNAQWEFVKAQRFSAAPQTTSLPTTCKVVTP